MTLQTREDAMFALETARADWLRVAREHAIRLARRGNVTVNDVRQHAPPLPEGADSRVYGAIFNTPDFEFVRYVKSNRKTSHCRPIAEFRLAQYEYAG